MREGKGMRTSILLKYDNNLLINVISNYTGYTVILFWTLD